MSRAVVRTILGLATAALIAGCGGGSDNKTQPPADRALQGTVNPPPSAGSLSEVAVVIREVVKDTGVSSETLATGTYDASTRTYQVPDPPADKVMVVEATGKTASNMTVAIRAAVGSALGRSPSRATVTVDLNGQTTIAAAAVETMAKSGTDPSTITATQVTNLEKAAVPLVLATDFTDATKVTQQAQAVLTTTSNGSTDVAPSGTPTLNAARLFPMHAGDVYNYRGTETYNSTTNSSDWSWTVGAARTVDGRSVYPFTDTSDPDYTDTMYFLADTSAGIAGLGSDDVSSTSGTYASRYAPPLIYIPNGLPLGSSVTQTTVETSTDPASTSTYDVTLTVTFVAQESVTVPAGTFADCARLTVQETSVSRGGRSGAINEASPFLRLPRRAAGRSRQSTDTLTLWFAPDVGYVKERVDWESGNYENQLISATVNGHSYP